MESFSSPRLYPERPSAHLDRQIAELKESESAAIELPESEKTEILAFEDMLGAQLEAVNAIKSSNFSVNLDYFESEQGRDDFSKVFGITLPDGVIDQQSLKVFLYNHQSRLKETPLKVRGEFEGRSRAFFEQQLSNALTSTLSRDGDIDVSVVKAPQDLIIQLSPKNSLEKIKRLRELKGILKAQYAALEVGFGQNTEVKMGILNLYAKRVNEMLVTVSQASRPLLDKLASGVELDEVEKEVVGMVYQTENSDRVSSRYDKFRYGASHELNAEGNYDQISSELAEFANKYAEAFNDSVKEGYAHMKGKGLDPEKVTDETMYGHQEAKAFAEEVLQSYGLLGEESSDTDRPDDGKWRVVVSEKFTTMSVNGGRRVVQIPQKSYSAKNLFTVTLAHEIEGHVLQHSNKAKLGLRLFNKVGGDRSVVFAEGGAMHNQDIVSRTAFGVSSTPNPHYLRTMVTKLNGGTYADCLKTFYDSALQPYKEMRDVGELSQEQFELEAKRNVKQAVNRTRRLFRNGGNYQSTDKVLTSSKDSAYLEGLILTEKLQEIDLHKFMYLTGVNIEALIFLMKSGLLSTKDIQAPTLKSLDIWEREKGKFSLTTTEK